MTVISAHDQIHNTFESISDLSYKQKKVVLSENEINNNFLDRILEIQSTIDMFTGDLNPIVDRMAELTWLSVTDSEDIKGINDIIAMGRDLARTMTKFYVKLNNSLRNCASNQIRNYKGAVDDLKEVCDDLETSFFLAEKDEEIKEINKILDSIE